MSAGIYRAFNTIYEEFFQKMKLLMPDEERIEDFHAGFLLLKRANNRAPLEMYIKSIFDFTLEILDKNEDFFMSHKKLNDIALDNSSFASKTGLHDKWSSFSDASKENIWTYVLGLTKLAFKAYNINDVKKCVKLKNNEIDVIEYLKNYQK